MKAALLSAPKSRLEVVDDIVQDAPGPGQVQVRVSHCGLCHSDLSLIDGAFPAPLPIVLGHEAAGVVEAIGDQVDSLAVGDPVVLTPCPPCGTCYFCVRGDTSVCEKTIGLATGTFADGSTGLRRGGDLWVALFFPRARFPACCVRGFEN